MKNNELLREEFLQRFFEPTFLDLKPYDNSYKDDEMIHWWLNKIQEARNSIKAELVKRLDDIPEASMKEAQNSSVISRDEAIGLVEKI